MQNAFSKGRTLDLTAPSGGVVSGTFYKIGALIVCAAISAAQGLPFTGEVHGCFSGVPKATGQAWTEGAVLYWDDTAKNFTTTATSNTKCAVAIAAAQTGDTTGTIKLIPSI
jgi:predicted RecA/RadA family phage recombinase